MEIKAETEKKYISLIIPCFNESETIGQVINKAKEIFKKQCYKYEIIVVDNCSTDDSAKIAKAAGAIVISSSAKTVAAVRNEGVRKASGKLLLFLDADVLLSESWGNRFSELAGEATESRVILGSHCCVPSGLKGLFREWYLRIEKNSRDTHIGSGHMLMSAMVFEELGGFDENLSSGEDYELCKRAKSLGYKLLIDEKLVAYHQGYPDTIKDFVIRERWHGMGDVTSLVEIVNSKVAVSALLFGILHLSTIILIFFSLHAAVFSLASIFFLCVFIVMYKFRVWSLTAILKLLPAVYFYLTGRFLSFF